MTIQTPRSALQSNFPSSQIIAAFLSPVSILSPFPSSSSLHSSLHLHPSSSGVCRAREPVCICFLFPLFFSFPFLSSLLFFFSLRLLVPPLRLPQTHLRPGFGCPNLKLCCYCCHLAHLLGLVENQHHPLCFESSATSAPLRAILLHPLEAFQRHFLDGDRPL